MWTKEQPIPPPNEPSDWYWYYEPEVGLDIIEVWPKRYLKHYTGWWWNEPVKKAFEHLPEPRKKAIKEPVEIEKPKRKRIKRKGKISQ